MWRIQRFHLRVKGTVRGQGRSGRAPAWEGPEVYPGLEALDGAHGDALLRRLGAGGGQRRVGMGIDGCVEVPKGSGWVDALMGELIIRMGFKRQTHPRWETGGWRKAGRHFFT